MDHSLTNDSSFRTNLYTQNAVDECGYVIADPVLISKPTRYQVYEGLLLDVGDACTPIQPPLKFANNSSYFLLVNLNATCSYSQQQLNINTTFRFDQSLPIN